MRDDEAPRGLPFKSAGDHADARSVARQPTMCRLRYWRRARHADELPPQVRAGRSIRRRSASYPPHAEQPPRAPAEENDNSIEEADTSEASLSDAVLVPPMYRYAGLTLWRSPPWLEHLRMSISLLNCYSSNHPMSGLYARWMIDGSEARNLDRKRIASFGPLNGVSNGWISPLPAMTL